jgi:hypothetical protein
MKVLGIRFCTVTRQAEDLADFLANGLGLELRGGSALPDLQKAEVFTGAVFPAGEGSWIEMWPEGPGMPAGIMLQIVVDDADAWAEQARKNGLNPMGPADSHGERIYFLKAPSKLTVTIQSKAKAKS